MAYTKEIEIKISANDDGLPGLKRLTAGLDEAGVEAGKLRTLAGKAVETLQEVAQQQQAVETLRNLAAQGRELGARLNGAAAEVDRLGAALQETKDAMAQSDGASKEAAKQLKALEREYTEAVAAAKRASSALGENQRAMDAARQAARDLGIDTTKLTAEKRRLEAAAQEARKGLDAVAASVERVRQRQVEAAGVLQAFQGDLKKLGLEGPQAPAGLEQAFRKLGIDGVKKAEAAVHELQIALAQVRNSPDVLPADKKAAVAAFNKEVERLKAEASPAAKATRELADAGDAAGKSLGGAATKVAAWAGALVGLNELKSLAGQVLETGSAFENLEVRLTNLLGGADAAASAMGMIKDLAATTPFEVTALAESFVKLTAFGMQPTEAQMRSLADVAANLGGGTEVLTGVTLALGQAWVKGKLQGEEIMQLAERGVPVWDALAKATGRTVPELQKMSEAGALGRDVIKGLIDELGRMNAGASEQLMSTYAGAVSNAKDALAEFFDMIAKAGVLDFLTEKIRDLLAEFERMKETGELEQKAEEIAEAFVAVAKTAEAVTLTLIDMAPVIEVAVKAWLAFKAVNIAASLYSIAAGAAVAAPAMAATAVGARTAAAGMTVAAGAATALSVAIKRLLAATGIGLLLVAVGEIGLRLFGVGEAAKTTEKDLDAVFEPPTTNGPAAAAKQAEKGLEDLKTTAQISGAELRKTFDDAVKSGRDVDQALNEIGKGFDLSSVPGIQNAAVVLDGLLSDGEITAEQFRAAWDKSLKGIDLGQFELNARVALDGTWQGVGRLQDALDAGLRSAIQRSGADFDVLAGGMGKAATSAIADTDAIIGGMDRLKAQGVDVGSALEASLSKAVNTADGQKSVDELRKRIESMRKELGDKVTDGLLSDLQKQAEKLGATFDALPAKAKSVAERTAEAFKNLGVQTAAELKQAASEAARDFELIEASGQATADGLSQAWQKMAEASIAANGGVASETLQAEAAMYGLEISVDKTGKAIVRNMRDAKDAVGEFKEAVDDAVKSAEQLEALQKGEGLRGKNYIRERNKRVGSKEAEEEERKRLNVDKDGFSLDKSGNRLAMGGDLTTLTGIKNFLQQAGLEEEQAKKLAREFADSKGDIPYFSNPGQLKYGGEGSTMSQALLKAAERVTFGLGSNGAATVGGQQAGDGSRFLEPSSSRHVVEFRNGVRSKSFKAASATDASAAAAIIRELATAQLRSS
jgi:tape measure domain-containing protein